MRTVKLLTVVLVVILARDAFCQHRPNIFVRKLSVSEYPPLARQARQQGDVTAKVALDERGQVVSVSEIKGPQFLRSTIETVRDWMFIVPDKVPTSFLLTFRFKLVGEERQYPHHQFKAELPELVEITVNPTTEKPGPDFREALPKR